ncbi:hypothetical protein ACJJTC_002441 [Scirpophaga incertulas]
MDAVALHRLSAPRTRASMAFTTQLSDERLEASGVVLVWAYRIISDASLCTLRNDSIAMHFFSCNRAGGQVADSPTSAATVTNLNVGQTSGWSATTMVAPDKRSSRREPNTWKKVTEVVKRAEIHEKDLRDILSNSLLDWGSEVATLGLPR